MKKIINIIKWMVVAFFVTTIFSVIIYKYVPVYVTPLMVIRTVSSSESIHHKWISLEEMPKDIVKAVIASEDAHFLSHNGFDFKAIKQAIEHNKKNNKTKRGASTISQQTAKNVFLWPSRSWLRKGLEAYFTVLIELFWDKQRIIEVYLNSIEMGDGIFGIAAVADKHFDKEPEKLTKRQCALIAATLPNPIKFNSAAPSPYMRKRQRVILREMNSV
ncbi:MAG: monofunctional biosynthetic peptidoglycan transglycosylase, partial [Prevotella sp.]|nr:monofunctional biosynthetic peptidoglycan transglycosylase [Prevotella sp.]